MRVLSLSIGNKEKSGLLLLALQNAIAGELTEAGESLEWICAKQRVPWYQRRQLHRKHDQEWDMGGPMDRNIHSTYKTLPGSMKKTISRIISSLDIGSWSTIPQLR